MSTTTAQPTGAGNLSAVRISDESRFNAACIAIAGPMPDGDPVRIHGTGAYRKIYLSPRKGSGIHCQHVGGFTRDNVSPYASFGSYRCLTFAELTEAVQAGDLVPEWGTGISL